MTQNNALVGYSGFVGGNLLRQQDFKAEYNSKNIAEIRGKSFDTVVCCGAPAAKWIANKEPESDKANIDSLIAHLTTVETGLFVLISTVDVYREPIAVDETTDITAENLHPYGLNRYRLEQFVKSHFKNHIILRLPGLFGFGLKKNVIYDFLNNNNIDKIESRSEFQFYNLDNLSRDIQLAHDKQISLLNLSSEPVSVKELAQYCFGIDFNNQCQADPVRYDFRTAYASQFGKNGYYLYDKRSVLDDMKHFVERTRAQ